MTYIIDIKESRAYRREAELNALIEAGMDRFFETGVLEAMTIEQQYAFQDELYELKNLYDSMGLEKRLTELFGAYN